MGHRIGSNRKEKTAPKPSLRDLFSDSQTCPLLLTLLALAAPQAASSEVFFVTDSGDYAEHLKEAPRAGTLRDAIRRAQKQPNQHHTIVIKTAQTIQLKSSLPPISAEGLQIIGGGNKPAVIDGQNKYNVGALPKNLNIANVDFQNFSTQGSSGGNGVAGGGGGPGLGGFAYISPGTGTTTYSNTTFSNNSVQGGTGGDGTFNYTGTPAGSGKFVEGGGGGAGPNGAGGDGETANAIAEGSTSGGYGGGGGGGAGIPRGNLAPGGSTESFGGGGGASNHVSGNSVLPPVNPSFPPNLANYIGADGTSSDAADRGGAGGNFVLNKNYEVSNGEHSAQGGGGGGSGSTSDKVTGSAHGGNSNFPTGVYPYGGGGGGGGGHSKTASGNGGAAGVYSGGGGGGSAIASTKSGAGGAGGFGGGGGGSGPYSTARNATSGFAGGQGAIGQLSEGLVYGGGGGGGAGLGGALYLDSGISPLDAVTVVLNNCLFSSNRTEGGKGGTNTIEQASSGQGLGQDVFMTAGSTLTVNMNNTNPTIDLWGDGGARAQGAISLSSGGLNVNGAGTLTLPAGSGNRNYSGTVTVGSGSTLAFNSDQDLGLVSNPIHLNDGTLQSDNLTTDRTIAISGQGTFKNNAAFQATGLIQDGETPGKVTLSGTGDFRIKPATANTYSGGTEISPGATVYPLSGDKSFGAATGPITFLPGSSDSAASIQVSGSGSSLNSARSLRLLGDGHIVIDPSASASFSGPITGRAQLKVEGTGTATISANSSTTYSGTLLNNIAQLNLSGDQPIGRSSTLEIGPSASHIGFASTHLPSAIHAANSVAMTATSGNSALTGPLSGSGAIQAASKGGKLAFTPARNNTSYTGDMSATALQSSGINPFGVGDLTLTDSLELVGSGTYGNSKVTLNGPVTLQTHAGTVSTFGPSTAIEGTTLLTINGPGAVHITSSDNSLSAQTLVNGATLGLSGTNSLSNSPIYFDQGTLRLLAPGTSFSNNLYLTKQSLLTLQADRGSTSTHSGTFNGDYTTAISYQGPGELQLAGANTTFGGTFDLQSGTLKTSGTNPMGVGAVILDGTDLVLADAGTYANSWTVNAPTTTIVAQSGTSAFSGNINSSSGNINFTGPGTLQLSGNNTNYTGLITVKSGSLQVADSSNLGGASIAIAGGELNLTGSSNFNHAFAVGSALLNVGSLPNTWSGTLSGSNLHITGYDGGKLVLAGNNENFASGFTVDNGVVLSVAAQSQLGTGSVILKGSSLNLSGSDTFTNNIALSTALSTISLNGGSNAITGAFTGYAPFELNGSGSLALTNGKSFKGAVTLAGGTLQLSGVNPIGPGQIRWNGGALEVTGNSSFSNPAVFNVANSPILVGSGHTATFTGGLSGSGGLLFNSPDGTLVLSNNTYTGETSLEAGTIQTSGTNPLGTGTLKYVGGSLQFVKDGRYANAIELASNQTITLAPSTSSTISGPVSGLGSLTFSGFGAVILTADNTQSGGIVLVDEATVIIDSDNNLGLAASPFIFSTGNGTLILSSPVAFSERTFTLDGNGTIQLPAGTTTISSQITGAGTLTLVDMNGNGGTLAITAPASYGDTILKGAILQLSDSGTLGTGSVTFSENNAGRTSILNLIAGSSYSNPLIMTNKGTIASSTAATTNAFSGSLLGSERLTLQGPGGFSLLADNSSFSGGLTLTNTTLISSESNQLGSGHIVFNSGSALHLTGSDTYSQPMNFAARATISSAQTSNTLTGHLSGLGGFTHSGNGTLAVVGNNTFAGGVTLDSGDLQVQGFNPLGTGLFTLNGGHFHLLGTTTFSGPIQINSNGVINSTSQVVGTFSGHISGVGALTLNSPGTTIITGNNTYTGGTFLSNGTLQVSGPSPLGTGSVVLNGENLEWIGNGLLNPDLSFVAGTTITTPRGITARLGGKLSGGGNFVKEGEGTVVLSGTSSLTGATTVAKGQLVVDGSLTASPVTVNASAILKGTGNVGDVNVIGIIRPGDSNSTGTLHAQHVTFQGGSVFRPTADGSIASVLDATSITIMPNAILDPFLDPFLPKTYTIAQGLVSGSQFMLGYSGTALFPVRLIQNSDSILLSVTQTPFSALLPRGNALNIAECFAQLPTSSDLTAVSAVIYLLPPSALESAFAQFDTSFYNAITYVEEAVMYRTRAIYTAHSQNRRFEGDALWSVWGTGFGESIHQHRLGNDGGQSGYDDHLTGFVTGIDGWALNHLLVTGGFSYGHSAVNWNQVNASSGVKSYTGFLGSTWFGQKFAVDGYVSYTYHEARGHRKIYISPTNLVTPPVNSHIPFEMFGASIDRKLYETSQADSGTFHLGGLYADPLQAGFSFLSFANLDYFVVSQDTFEEKGGGVLNMALRSKTSDLLRPEVGVGIGYLFSAYEMNNFFANATIGYVHEFRFSGRGTPTTFAGNACQFQLYGLFPQQNFVTTSIEVGAANLYNFSLSLNYTGIFGSHYVDNGGQLELTYLF